MEDTELSDFEKAEMKELITKANISCMSEMLLIHNTNSISTFAE